MSDARQLGAAEREAIRAAAQWYARLASETAGEREHRAWQRWLEADPAHRDAWQRIESVRQQMGQVPGRLAASTLTAAGHSRRRVLLGAALLVSASGVAALGWNFHRIEQGGERRLFPMGRIRMPGLAKSLFLVLFRLIIRYLFL